MFQISPYLSCPFDFTSVYLLNIKRFQQHAHWSRNQASTRSHRLHWSCSINGKTNFVWSVLSCLQKIKLELFWTYKIQISFYKNYAFHSSQTTLIKTTWEFRQKSTVWSNEGFSCIPCFQESKWALHDLPISPHQNP